MTEAEKLLPFDKKWIAYFSKFPEDKNLFKIVSFILSIPHSNAPSERIFSLMTTAWRKERNNLLEKNLEAELMVKENFKLTCNEFKNFLNTTDGSEILKLAKSYQKYTKQIEEEG